MTFRQMLMSGAAYVEPAPAASDGELLIRGRNDRRASMVRSAVIKALSSKNEAGAVAHAGG